MGITECGDCRVRGMLTVGVVECGGRGAGQGPRFLLGAYERKDLRSRLPTKYSSISILSALTISLVYFL